MAHVRRIKRSDENIALTDKGEVVRSLASSRVLLRSDLAYLEQYGSTIFSRLLKAPKGSEVPYCTPENILKRSVYTLGLQLNGEIKKRQKSRGKILTDFIQNGRKDSKVPLISKSAPDADENPFFWFYHLLLCEHRLPKDKLRLVKRSQLSKLSRHLVYAAKNDVPEVYLVGFLMQIGGDQIIELHRKQDWKGWQQASKSVKSKKVNGIID